MGAAEARTLSPLRWAELRHACRRLLYRSILTLSAVEDPDRRFRRGPRSWPFPQPVIRAAELDHEERLRKSRGEGSERACRFQPTPEDIDRYLDVLQWLNHLKDEPEGERTTGILTARAHDVPLWRLAQRFRCSEKTVQRREAAAIDTLTRRFWRDIDRMA